MRHSSHTVGLLLLRNVGYMAVYIVQFLRLDITSLNIMFLQHRHIYREIDKIQ